MNFKQKLAYMTIGCVFTLAGYFLAILGTGGGNLCTAIGFLDHSLNEDF